MDDLQFTIYFPILWLQAVLRHALHILLNNGFHLALHLGLLRQLVYEVVLHQRISEGIGSRGLLAIKLDDMTMLDILIETIHIVDSPCLLGRSVEHIDATWAGCQSAGLSSAAFLVGGQ